MMQNNHLRKITAWVAAVATVFVMLFSSLYIVEHSDHECGGADCPICAVMAQCSNNLKTIGLAVVVVAAMCGLIDDTKAAVTIGADNLSVTSLISQKVRMNN